jgi:hypothetical protein
VQDFRAIAASQPTTQEPVMKYLTLVAAFVTVAAYAQPPSTPAPVSVENTQKMSAKVEAVDQAKRTVTVRAANGLSTTIDVSPDVKNLAQVKVGDDVVVRYYEGLAAEVTKKGQGTPVGTVRQGVVGGTAEPGQRPAAAVGNVVTTTVVIEAVDKAANKVTFKGPRGSRTVAVKRPEAQKFIAGLKKGDEVDITYTEALAVSVEPSK